MIEERYLKMATNIRRTYLKLVNNLDLYQSKVKDISEKLELTCKKIDDLQNNLKKSGKNYSEKEGLESLLKIINEVDLEGKRLESFINPINLEIEKLSKEESELYRQIVEHHVNLTQEQIVSCVRDRLISEGLN